MTIDIKKQNNEAVITVAGVLDGVTALALARTIRERAKTSASITLDLNGIDYISSEALGVLLGTRKKLKGTASFKLSGICESVMQILEKSRQGVAVAE